MAKSLPPVGVIILAGGLGHIDPEQTHRSKLLESVYGQPVLHHVINAAKGMKTIRGEESLITLVISRQFEDGLRESLRAFPGIRIAVQPFRKGTLDALRVALDSGTFPKSQHLLVIMGDMPLVTSEDLDLFVKRFSTSKQTRAAILAFREDRRKPEFVKCGVVQFFRGRFACF